MPIRRPPPPNLLYRDIVSHFKEFPISLLVDLFPSCSYICTVCSNSADQPLDFSCGCLPVVILKQKVLARYGVSANPSFVLGSVFPSSPKNSTIVTRLIITMLRSIMKAPLVLAILAAVSSAQGLEKRGHYGGITAYGVTTTTLTTTTYVTTCPVTTTKTEGGQTYTDTYTTVSTVTTQVPVTIVITPTLTTTTQGVSKGSRWLWRKGRAHRLTWAIAADHDSIDRDGLHHHVFDHYHLCDDVPGHHYGHRGRFDLHPDLHHRFHRGVGDPHDVCGHADEYGHDSIGEPSIDDGSQGFSELTYFLTF